MIALVLVGLALFLLRGIANTLSQIAFCLYLLTDKYANPVEEPQTKEVEA